MQNNVILDRNCSRRRRVSAKLFMNSLSTTSSLALAATQPEVIIRELLCTVRAFKPRFPRRSFFTGPFSKPFFVQVTPLKAPFVEWKILPFHCTPRIKPGGRTKPSHHYENEWIMPQFNGSMRTLASPPPPDIIYVYVIWMKYLCFAFMHTFSLSSLLLR